MANIGSFGKFPWFEQQPLMRLLAINLIAGVAMALLIVGGLIALDLGGIRGLIFDDHSPVIALGLLSFGFIITFGSWVMGTAIMMLGRDSGDADLSRAAPHTPIIVQEPSSWH